MKKFFAKQTKKIAASLAVLTLMSAISLVGAGQLWLLPALLVGYFLGATYFFTVGLRLARSMGKPKAAAKREMLLGMLLRLVLVFAALAAAIKISFTLFMTVVAGFGAFYVLTLAHLIIAVFRLDILSEDEGEERTSFPIG